MIAWLVSAYCSLPNFRGKQRGLRLAPSFTFARSFYGPLMARNVADSTWRACMAGAYGTFLSDFIAAQDEPFTFWDIGANQGIFALCAARNPCCVGVLALEPNPRTFDFLARNIEANNTSAIVRPINAAIAEGDTIELHVSDGHSGAASMFGAGPSISVPAIHPSELSAMVEGRVIAKIDVEGAETIVLSVLEKAGVFDKITAIVIEVSENISGAEHSRDLVAFLTERGWWEHSRSGSAHHYDAIYFHARHHPSSVAAS